jgi:hypothetical protein
MRWFVLSIFTVLGLVGGGALVQAVLVSLRPLAQLLKPRPQGYSASGQRHKY